MLNEIKWPEKWLPGTTDNFAQMKSSLKIYHLIML